MNVNEIIKQMTLEEKVKLLTGRGRWKFNGIPRLGIRDFVCSDGPHGLRAFENFDGESNIQPATLFPCAAAMASTWNLDLIKKVGRTIGEECNHYKVDVLLAPGVNGKRNPLAGRNFEYYSEDPYLTGKIASSYIKGVQSVGVGTSLKHFILNEQETGRRYVSSKCDKRTLREIYALPFEMAIKEAKPMTIMCSYNRIDGVYASESKDVLTKLLRRKLKYKGVVISDWGAVQNKFNSINNGLDIEMPEPRHHEDVIKAVKDGIISEKTIDKRVRYILKMYQKLLSNRRHGKPTDFEKNHLVAQKVAREAIVLLKNENVLPLYKGENVGFIGELLIEPRINGGGSSSLKPYRIEKPLEELSEYGDYKHAIGYKGDEIDEELINDALEVARTSSKVILFVGTTSKIESEGFDRKNMDLPLNQQHLLEKVLEVNDNVVLVNSSGSPINLAPYIDRLKGVVQTWFLGQANAKALIEVLFGKTNPSGKLSETWPLHYDNVITSRTFPEKYEEAKYTEGLYTGYRYFDSFKIPVLFPFGFGLSYTEFEYSNLRLSKKELTNGETLTVSVDVTNVGKIRGQEVVQVYVKDKECHFDVCEKYLKGFAKVTLKPKETKTVTITLDESAFSMFVEEFDKFMVESGEFEILIGKNVSEIVLKDTIYFDSKDEITKPLTIKHPVMMWLRRPKEKAAVERFLSENDRKLSWWGYEDPLIKVVTRMLRNEGFKDDQIDEEIRKYFRDFM